jgi:hypothetical protein
MAGDLQCVARRDSTRTARYRYWQITLKTFAAILPQKFDDRIHAVVLSAADYRAPDLFLRNKACVNQPAQMKGQCRRRNVKAGLDVGNVESNWSGPNQKPVDVEPGQVAQLGQAARGEFSIHGTSHYSKLEAFTTIILVI